MSSPAPSTRQVLVGLFILWQLIFLISANLIGFLKDNREYMPLELEQAVEAIAPGWPKEQGHAWQIMEHVAKTDRLWAEATGQLQYWMLFAPTIARECVFPAVELHWDGETKLVLSENEPSDLNLYFRFGNYRLRRYESNLTLALRPDACESLAETNERWRDRIRTFVTGYADILDGYLSWRTGRALRDWPDKPRPDAVVLLMRRYHINDFEKAPSYWTGPHSVAVARRQFSMESGKGKLEWHDPVTGRFMSVQP